MKKLFICILSLLIIFSATSCASKPSEVMETTSEISANSLASKEFNSIDSIKTEKASVKSNDDKINIKEVNKILQISSLPNGVTFDKYIITKEYCVSFYNYNNTNENLMSLEPENPTTNESLTTMNLTVYRTLGQEAFNIFTSENKQSGEVISSESIDKIFVVPAISKGEIFAKVYFFVYKNEYMTLSVPGNISEDVVKNMIDNIQKIEIP
jgi:hypothetical protein